MARVATVVRETKESRVSVKLNLDGSGVIAIDTGVPFFDHMLSQLGKHAGFDLEVKTVGDVDVDSEDDEVRTGSSRTLKSTVVQADKTRAKNTLATAAILRCAFNQ